jgi:hypothetical protein
MVLRDIISCLLKADGQEWLILSLFNDGFINFLGYVVSNGGIVCE